MRLLAGWRDGKRILMGFNVLLNNTGKKGKDLKWVADLTT